MSATFTAKGSRLALVAMWLFLLSPMLLYPLWRNGRGWLDTLYVFNFVTSALWVGLLHFAVRRPFLLHVVLAPFYFLTAIDLFLLGAFDERFSSGFVYIALSNIADAGDFFATYARPIFFSAVAMIFIYVSGLFAIRQLRVSQSRKVSLGCALILLAIYSAALARNGGNVPDLEGKELSAPIGDAFQVALALQIANETRESAHQRAQNSLDARPLRRNENEIYVWIIGESSRPQNWSLFGYQRDTTPRLRSLSGVIPLPDMLTTGPHTQVAVPSMLSLRPITDWTSVLAQRSVVSAFNEAGFITYWFSCQEADSWAAIVPVVAAEATHKRFHSRAFDGVLLDDLRSALDSAAPGQKLFFVLHTKGSHFEYSRRYPPEFARFGTPGGTGREQLVDSYDNSVLYTDWLVSEVIAVLAKRNASSALIYASDHGENLLDDQAQLLGHGFGTKHDLHTAALIWLSEPFRARFPEMAKNLTAHAGARLNLSNLSHSLLDLAGIEASGLDRSMSVFDSSFAERDRWYMVRGKLLKEQSSEARAIRFN